MIVIESKQIIQDILWLYIMHNMSYDKMTRIVTIQE